jgi:hypothetical protein
MFLFAWQLQSTIYCGFSTAPINLELYIFQPLPYFIKSALCQTWGAPSPVPPTADDRWHTWR